MFGANTTTINFLLKHPLARTLQPGDEIVVTQLDPRRQRLALVAGCGRPCASVTSAGLPLCRPPAVSTPLLLVARSSDDFHVDNPVRGCKRTRPVVGSPCCAVAAPRSHEVCAEPRGSVTRRSPARARFVTAAGRRWLRSPAVGGGGPCRRSRECRFPASRPCATRRHAKGDEGREHLIRAGWNAGPGLT